jgi:hypothetical protein
MANLGNLGVPKSVEVDSFGWFGAEIRVHPRLTDLALMDFIGEAAKMEEDDPRVTGFIKEQARLVIHPDDFDAFWQGALDNGQSSIDLLTVMKTIVESQSARPTRLPAGSWAGQPQTVVTSPDVSSLPDTAASPLMAMDRRAIEGMAGRPELMLVADRAARERAAAAG